MKDEFKIFDNRFNSLPIEIRQISVDSEIRSELNSIRRQAKRLRDNYNRELEFLGGRRKTIERELRRRIVAINSGKTDVSP